LTMNARQIGDLCSLVIAAWAFAMIGLEVGAHHQPTHSGTQEVVR
jgi:hypothetical protein